MEIKEVTCTILKKGRKWYKAKLKDKSYEVSISMNNCNFEENKEYTFAAEINIERNKYGVKTYIYPIPKEKYEDIKQKEKENNLIKEFNQYFAYCKEKDYVYTNGFNKLENTINDLASFIDTSEYKVKVNALKSEKIILQLKNNLNEKISQIKSSSYLYDKGISICNTIINELKNKFKVDTKDFELKLNNVVKIKTEELKKEREYKHKQCINNLIDKGLLVDISGINDDDILSKYKEKFKEVPEEDYDGYLRECFDIVDTSKYIDVILNSLEIPMDKRDSYKNLFMDNIPNKYTNINNTMYILTISLSNDTFKHFIKNEYIIELNSFYNEILSNIDVEKNKDNRYLVNSLHHTLNSNEYICINPKLLVKQLYNDGILKNINNLDTEEDKDNTFIRMTLNAPLEKNTWDYRKDTVYNELYYIVRESKPNGRGGYYAYYILGQDHDTKKGFAHRLPWKEEGFYEDMSVKEIIDDTFYYNQNYTRIQGDIVYKEISIAKNNIKEIKTFQGHTTKITLENNLILNIICDITETTCKYLNNNLEKENETSRNKNDFVVNEFDIRKNFKLAGDHLYHRFLHDDIFKKNFCDASPKYYDINDFYFSFNNVEYSINTQHNIIPAKPNSIIVISHKDNIDDISSWTKLNYGYFYKYLSIKDSKEVEFKKSVVLTDYEKYYIDNKPISSNSIKFRKYTNSAENEALNNLSNHVVNGNIKFFSNNILIVEGPFTITHHQHHKVSSGKENKYYIIRNAKRHRTSNTHITID